MLSNLKTSKFYHMKKILLSLSLIAVLGFTAQSQSIVKLDPLSLAFGSFRAGYETFTSDKTSLYGGLSFVNRGILDIKYRGIGVFGQYRFYLSNTEAPKGIFAGPHIGANFIGFDSGIGDRENYTLLRIGGIIGYQGLIGTNFTWEIGIGPTYGLIFSSLDDDDFFGNGIVPIGTFALGYIIN